MALKFYGQFAQDDEEQKTPSQVAKEQVSGNGLKFYGQFAEAGQEQASRMSQFKASEPTPKPTTTPAPTVAPKESLWDRVSQAVKSVIQSVAPKSQAPVISPIPEQKKEKTTVDKIIDVVKQRPYDVLVPQQTKDTIETVGKSFVAGVGDVEYTAGRTLSWLGQDGIGTKLSKQGQYMQSFAPQDLGEFEWHHLYDPRFWSTTVTRSLPFSLSLMPTAILGAYAGAGTAGAIGLGSFGTLLLGSIGGASLARPLESALEAGSAYDEAIQKGKTKDQANEAANKTFKGNLALTSLDAAEFALAFAPIKGGGSLMRRILKTAGGLAGNVFMEGGEELLQRNIQRVSQGEKIDITSKEAQQEFALGGIMGAGLEVSGSIFNKIKENVIASDPEAQKQYAKLVSEGVPQDQAEIKVLDTMAKENPKQVEQIIESTIEQLTMPLQLQREEGSPTEQPPSIQPTQKSQTAKAVVTSKPVISSDVSFQLNKAISTYVSDEGVYKKPDGTTEQTPSLKELTAIAKTPEAQKITETKVSEAIDKGDIKTNEDGSITVYRVGSMRDDNRLTSVSFDKKAAESFKEQASVTGGDRPITAIQIQPSDIKVFVGGTEKELLIQSKEKKAEPEVLKKLDYDPTRLEKHIGIPNTGGNPTDRWEAQIRYKGFAADHKYFDTKEEAQKFLDNYVFKGMSSSVADVYAGSKFEETYKRSLAKIVPVGDEAKQQRREIFNKYFDKTNLQPDLIEAKMVLASQVEEGKITYEQMAKEVGMTYTPPSPTEKPTTPPQPQKKVESVKTERVGDTKVDAVKTQESTNTVIDAIQSGDLEAAQAIYTDMSVDADVQMAPFSEILASVEAENKSVTNEVEQITMDLKTDAREGDEPTAALLRIADRIGKYFSAPRTLFIITGKDRTYRLPNGDKITVGGDTTEALDRLIFTSDIDGFGKSISVLARKFNKVFSEIDAIIKTGGIDGGDYEQFKTTFREYIAKRPNYSAGRSGIVKDVPKQVASTDSKTISVEPVTPVTENVAPETIDEKVQRSLDEKQKNKDIKDVGERVGGSKKEMSAFKRVTIADLSGIDDTTAYQITTKDRVIGEFDPQLYKDAGHSSGIVYLKDRLHSLLRSKPENSSKARELYLTRMPEIMKRVDDAKTFDDIHEIAKDIEGGSDKFSSWFSRNEPKKMSEDEMIFGKTFINLMKNKTEATRQTWKEATHYNAITDETLKQVYDRDVIQSARRLEYNLKRMEDPEKEYLSMLRMISPKEYRQVTMEKKSDPEAFKKRLETYKQQQIESINRMYSPIIYEDWLKRTKYEVKPDDWSWMTKESPKQKQASGDMEMHTVEPLSEIVRINGRVVTDSELDPQVLKDQYGYESVQFGNSISDKESKAHIKYYLASMKDLEDILQLDVAQINREAKLSIAFAARGSGRALAHYESMRKIINITKTRGGGAAGHEWFHYLDHVIGGARPNLEKSMGFASGGYRTQKSEWFTADTPETPYAVRQALKGVMDAMERGDNGHTRVITVSNTGGSVRYPSIKQKFDEGGHDAAMRFIQQYNTSEPEKNLKYYEDLARIEGKDIEASFKYPLSKYLTDAKGFKSDYWSRPTELFARAGQAYIQDKMAEQGIQNNYITHNVDVTQSKSTDLWSKDGLNRAYPQGVERQKINEAFDKLFETLRSKYPYHQSSEQRVNETIGLATEQEVNTAKEEAQQAATPKAPTGSGHADVGGYRDDGSQYFTGNMKGVEFPELLKMAVEFTGDVPALKKFTTKLGVFYPRGGGEIKLNYEIFKNPSQAAKTFAHEIGHLVDYLPDRYMNRGNILGRIASLNHYLKRFMKESPTAPDEPITDKVKEALRKQAKELSNTKQLSELTPQDVLDIWNSVEVKNKDLESYIAKLDATQKKDILKSAIKGFIPEWVDFKAPDNNWKLVYEKLLKEEIIKRKLVDEKIVKQELKDLTQYWKPFDENASADFTKYRYSSVELYADAISVLLNDPEALKAKAPTFYKGFFNWLDNKPEVKKAFFDTWDLINRGEEAVFLDRQKAITDSEMQAEEKWRLKEQERTNVKRNLPYMLATLFQDKDAVIIGKIEKLIKEGKDIAPEDNPRYSLHSLNYLDGEIRAWLDKKVVPVFNKANEVGNGWSLLNQILQWERAIYERGDMANPHGHNPKTAADSLRMLEKTTDPEDWKKLQESKDLFRGMVKDFIDFADKHGYYKPELIETMKANPAYSTYQVVDYLDENISPKVYKSKGTLKGVANTATSTVMKLISTYKAIARNDAKISIIDTLNSFAPDEIEPAKTVFVNTKRPKQFIEPKDKNLELVIGVKDGEMVGYYVPKDIARSLNYHENEIVQSIAKIAKFVSATPVYRPIMTTINFGFQLGNLLSDFMRNWENYPDKNLLEAIKSFGAVSAEYAKVLPSAYRKAAGIDDPLITDMREKRMLGVGFKGIFSDEELEASQKIDRVLGKYGVTDVEETNKIKAIVKKVWDAVSFFGEVIESLPKLAAYERIMNRTDLSDQEKAEYIRTQAGSPDFRLGGTATPITNAVFMFSNAQIQAFVADARTVADPNYKPYRTAYFFKLLIGAIIPTLIAIAIKEGLMGEDLKKQQDNISEYDKSNYNIIPYGFDENGKTIYTRVRKSERDRLIGGLIWKAARMFGSEKMGVSDLMEVFSYAGGQVPNLSPNFKLINGIFQYMSGINPYDDFRNRNVIPDTAFKAGQKDPKYSLPYMLNWIIDTTGARIAIPKVPYQGERMTSLEKILNLPILSNAIGKWVKVSDYGQTEKIQEIRKEVQSNAAIKSLDRREAVDNAIKEYTSGSKDYSRQKAIETKLVNDVVGKVDSSEKKTSRTLLIKQFREGVIKGQADPVTNAIIVATSNEEKIQILKDARSKMDGAKFYKLITGFYQDKLISRDVIREVRK